MRNDFFFIEVFSGKGICVVVDGRGRAVPARVLAFHIGWWAQEEGFYAEDDE